ncbi:GNAT family N-acetyltransferase [Allosphingosinicella deserti]|uniref:GNAT family N-acetyltransferase n=1 Tax=Allosphingosinicella deserti TaxID=2116704 RepID=UPI0018EB23B4|nr:N-acetyltransferase [Sphingomonas deserti]
MSGFRESGFGEGGSRSIRPAEPRDAAAIRAVHLLAFPTPAEAALVDRLERDGDATVSLVADQEGEVIAHLLLSRMRVEGDGRTHRAAGLGPIGVLPPLQRSGLGSNLIRGALAIAEATREELVFVLGEPEYYGRFGFSAETASPFASPYAGPYLMALAFGDAPRPARGKADYAPAFTALGITA